MGIRFKKLIPIINAILVVIFAYHVLSIAEKFKGTREYYAILKVLLIPIILLALVVVINIILYWTRIGERE